MISEEDLVNAADDLKEQLQGVTVLLQGQKNNCPQGFQRWDPLFDQSSEAPIPRSAREGITLDDSLCYIYTSGTTGRVTAVAKCSCSAIQILF